MKKVTQKQKRPPKKTKASISSFEVRHQALLESQRLTGLSEEEFRSLLKTLSTCSVGYISYEKGDLSLTLEAFDGKIKLISECNSSKTEKKITHKFTPNELWFAGERNS